MVRYTAYVLYEMAKLMKSPADLTPSFAQWERYAEVCAGLFSTSMFGMKVAQISRLCGFTRNAQIRSKVNAAHAEEMAKALCAIGTVQTGQCESIDVVGGISCCWAVVFCDLLLGLRVQLLRSDGTLVFASQGAIGDKPQIRFLVGIGNNTDAIMCTGRIITLKSEEFVSRWHRDVDPLYAAVTGRLDWKTMICDSFDNVADILTIKGRGTWPFARLFSAAAVFYCHGRLASRYRQPEDFIQQAVLSIPELRPVHGILLQEAKNPIDLGSAAVKYWAALQDLRHIQNGTDSLACETIIVLAFLLGETFLDDSLQPTTFGIRHLFVRLSKASLVAKERTHDEITLEEFAKLDSHKFKGTNYVAEQAALLEPVVRRIHQNHNYDVRSIQRRLFCEETFEHNNGNFIRLFDILILLFTGFPLNRRDKSEVDSHYTSAIWSGGVYCYLDVLRNLSDEYQQASTIHVGRGCIQSSNQVYDMVLDPEQPPIWEDSFITRDVPPALLNFHVEKIAVEGLVGEHIVLTFCYRLRRHGKSYDIAPTRLLRSMGWNYRYRSDFQFNRFGNRKLVGQKSVDEWRTSLCETLLWKIRNGRAGWGEAGWTGNDPLLRCLHMCDDSWDKTVIGEEGDLSMLLSTYPKVPDETKVSLRIPNSREGFEREISLEKTETEIWSKIQIGRWIF